MAPTLLPVVVASWFPRERRSAKLSFVHELVGGLVALAGVEPVDEARRFVPAHTGGGFVGPTAVLGDLDRRVRRIVGVNHRLADFVFADEVGVGHGTVVRVVINIGGVSHEHEVHGEAGEGVSGILNLTSVDSCCIAQR